MPTAPSAGAPRYVTEYGKIRADDTSILVRRTSPTCNVPSTDAGTAIAVDMLSAELSTAVLPRVSSKNVRRLPSATTGTNTTPSWISIGIVDVSAGPNQTASVMVGVGTGDFRRIGRVVTTMPDATRGGTGDAAAIST